MPFFWGHLQWYFLHKCILAVTCNVIVYWRSCIQKHCTQTIESLCFMQIQLAVSINSTALWRQKGGRGSHPRAQGRADAVHAGGVDPSIASVQRNLWPRCKKLNIYMPCHAVCRVEASTPGVLQKGFLSREGRNRVEELTGSPRIRHTD